MEYNDNLMTEKIKRMLENHNNVLDEKYRIENVEKKKNSIVGENDPRKIEIHSLEKNFNLKKDIKEPFEYFEVLTDMSNFWIAPETLVKICKQFSLEQLMPFNLTEDNEVIFGESYILVEETFLKFIEENTHRPKYIPRLCLLKVVEYEHQAEEQNPPMEEVALAQTVDGEVEEVYIRTK